MEKQSRMGFFQGLLYGRDINRTEELLRQAPAPSLFLKLIHLYNTVGDEEKAAHLADAGFRMFPDSNELRKASLDVTRMRNAAEKSRVQTRLEQYPSPILYAKLATLQLTEEDYEHANRTCDAGCREFPKYGALWLVKARIHLALDQNDQARQKLQKATQLDHYNYDALILLAELQQQAGQFQQAIATCKQILSFSPEDETASKKLKKLEKQLAEGGNQPAPAAAIEPEEVVAETVVATPEPSASAAGSSSKTVSASAKFSSLLIELREQEGVEGALLWDPFGLVIAGALPDTLEEDLAAAMLAGVCRAMDSDALCIGELDEAILECDHGSIYMYKTEDMTLALFAAPNAKPGLIQRAVRLFAEHMGSADDAGEAHA